MIPAASLAESTLRLLRPVIGPGGAAAHLVSIDGEVAQAFDRWEIVGRFNERGASLMRRPLAVSLPPSDEIAQLLAAVAAADTAE